MSLSYKYAIAQLRADQARGERLNLAIVVFDEDRLIVHSARNLEKVRAISAALDRSIVEQALDNLELLDRNILRDGGRSFERRLEALNDLSPVCFSKAGQFFVSDSDTYETTVQRLLAQLVEPEPAPLRKPRQKRTRLLTSIKSALRSEKILASKGEGLDSHRVVLNQELAEGLSADMLLQNGAMHVVQTVDASHSERTRKAIQEIGISALIFEQARIRFGQNFTKPRLVYSASPELERSITPALNAAEHQGAAIVNWASRDDRTKFVVELSSLAKPSDAQVKASFGSVHASNITPRKLN